MFIFRTVCLSDWPNCLPGRPDCLFFGQFIYLVGRIVCFSASSFIWPVEFFTRPAGLFIFRTVRLSGRSNSLPARPVCLFFGQFVCLVGRIVCFSRYWFIWPAAMFIFRTVCLSDRSNSLPGGRIVNFSDSLFVCLAELFTWPIGLFIFRSVCLSGRSNSLPGRPDCLFFGQFVCLIVRIVYLAGQIIYFSASLFI